jgi:hypothetical protein
VVDFVGKVRIALPIYRIQEPTVRNQSSIKMARV